MAGDQRPLHNFSPETIAAQHRKFARTETLQRDDLPPINYAYHLDAGQYARFLRRYRRSPRRGADRRQGR